MTSPCTSRRQKEYELFPGFPFEALSVFYFTHPSIGNSHSTTVTLIVGFKSIKSLRIPV